MPEYGDASVLEASRHAARQAAKCANRWVVCIEGPSEIRCCSREVITFCFCEVYRGPDKARLRVRRKTSQVRQA